MIQPNTSSVMSAICPVSAMGPAWRRLFDELDRTPRPQDIDRALFTALLAAVPADEAWIDAAAAFSERGYRRNRIRAGHGYEALLMCWRRGQASPIHDHAGSLCGVRVLRGVATETVYDATDDANPVEIETREHRPGGVCVSIDADTHRISNEQAGEAGLITLHLYLPPLRSMKTLPVHEPLAGLRGGRAFGGFAGGDGI